MKTTVLKPRMSEKAYAQSQSGVYVFKVEKALDKTTIIRSVEAQFNVSVTSIKTLVQKGKAKRIVRKGGRPVAGRESDFKKAYVTLKEGDSIPVFAAVEEAETKAEKVAEKVEKAAAKADKKAKKEGAK